MVVLGALLVILILGGAAVYAGQVIENARQSGAFTSAPKTGSGRPAGAGRVGRARSAVRNAPRNMRAAPHNVRTIMAQAWADNWVAKKAHGRQVKAAAADAGGTAPPPVQRRPLGQRLLIKSTPNRPVSSLVPVTPGRPAAQTQSRPQAPPQNRPGTPPSPTSTKGTPPVQVNGNSTRTSSGGGAGADLFAAANAVTTQAKAGGIRAKLAATKTFSEALDHLAGALQDLARDMSEQGLYPPQVWEPVQQCATHVKAGAMSMSEADTSLTQLGNQTFLENAGSNVQAPHHQELNKD